MEKNLIQRGPDHSRVHPPSDERSLSVSASVKQQRHLVPARCTGRWCWSRTTFPRHCRTPFAHSTRHTIRHGRRSPLHRQGWCTSLCQTTGTRGQPGVVFHFTHLLLPRQNLGEGWWEPVVMCADTQRNEISLRRHTKTRNITGKLQRGLCLKAHTALAGFLGPLHLLFGGVTFTL